MMEKEIYRLKPTYPMNNITANLIMNPKPPTVYAILNSIANYGKMDYTKIRDLSKACHDKIFDFDYDLSDKINKDQFEIDILNHFMEMRIGFDTVTSFQLHLENKLHEILPYYNTLFDAIADYSLFNDGELIKRNLESDTNGNSTNDMRYSKYPQNQLSDISDGNYVTDQNYNTNVIDTNNVVSETISRSPTDKMTLYNKYLNTEKNKIMTMIYRDLNPLFYQVIE